MTVRLGRATIRSIYPNQVFEVILTIYAEQNIENVIVNEKLSSGLIFVKFPESNEKTLSKEQYPELAFIPKGTARSISYYVKLDINSKDFIRSATEIEEIIPQISGQVFAKSNLGKEMKSKIKTTTFILVAPFVIPTDIEFLDNGSIALVIRNIGTADAKTVIIGIGFEFNAALRKIRNFKMHIMNEDFHSNKYDLYFDDTEKLIEKLINQTDFIDSVINFFSKIKKQKIKSYKQEKPVPIEADKREKLVYATPISS